jgi:transcription antitermination factor NusG
MSIYGLPDDQAQSNSGLQWFALSVTPKLTQLVLTALEHKGYDCFTPLQSTTRKRRDQAADVQVPAFPGYVFARVDVRFRLPILVTPGVRGIVGYGRRPAPVDDGEILALRRVMQSQLPAKSAPYLRSGDRVQLVEGPLSGLTGLLIKHKGADRVLVQVTLINQALAVDVDSAWVRSLDAEPPRVLSASQGYF